MTGFAFAYAVMRVCGGQPRKNPGAPDLLYFPFSCIEDPMTTREQAWQVVTDIFGNCESINLYRKRL